MLYMTLSGEWTLSPLDDASDKHRGTVPGSVYSFLLADGSISVFDEVDAFDLIYTAIIDLIGILIGALIAVGIFLVVVLKS